MKTPNIGTSWSVPQLRRLYDEAAGESSKNDTGSEHHGLTMVDTMVHGCPHNQTVVATSPPNLLVFFAAFRVLGIFEFLV